MKREDIIRIIAAHKTRFEEEFGLKKIGLFGSYARGESSGQSDIDIVVDIEKPDMFHLIGIKQVIEEELGNKVDIIRLRDRMNQSLRARIERDVIYV
jgi:uncharacterized protein